MKSSILGGAAAVVVLVSNLAAADFWEKSEFVDWSDKEANKMLFDSPWAKEVVIARGGPRGAGGGGMGGPGGRGGGRGGPGVGGGAGGRGGGGAGGPGGGRGGMGGDPGGGMAMPVMRFLLRWHSALPVKQAVIRSSIGSESDLTDEHQAFLDREEQYYIVMLSGVPQRMAARFAENTERLKASASLERKGKAALAPEQVEVQQRPEAVDVYFLFPRTNAITPEDKEVEFVFVMGGRGNAEAGADDPPRGAGPGVEVKKKFKLKDMLFKGALAL